MPTGIWHAPLVGAALALSAGIALDRAIAVSLGACLALAVLFLGAWACCHAGRRRGLALVYLALAGIALGAAFHHHRRESQGSDDISRLAGGQPRPVQLRGRLDEEPNVQAQPPRSPLRVDIRDGATTAVLAVESLQDGSRWLPASGRVRVSGPGQWTALHLGDEVEVSGQLVSLAGPANPGEPDWAGLLRDQGITARILVRHTPSAVSRIRAGWLYSWRGWLAVIRGRAGTAFRSSLSSDTSGLAIALLLGDTQALPARDWERYQRTGVVHVLAISGQHLVVLAGLLTFLLPRLGLRWRQTAAVVAATLVAYALLAGGRPPVMRAAVTVVAASVAVLRCRLVLPANVLALAWLVVALIQPMDLASAGCQLSFLSVAVLYWGVRHVLARSEDPVADLVERTRPRWERGLRRLVRGVIDGYILTLLVWLAVTPLAASHFHVIALAGLWLGPPVVLLTNLALVFGFALLLLALVAPPLAPLAAWPLQCCLQACDALVRLGERSPLSYLCVADVPGWWLAGFYLGLLAVLTQEPLRRRRGWGMTAGLGWLCLGLLVAAVPARRDELRCTFLAVGHGGCTVLELPDGRTILYDAGSLAGPEVTARQIAPYLWHRGIRRIDEVLLSHADLDHFNGLVDLADRFAIGQVSLTPTFAHKPIPAVSLTLDELGRRGIPVRIVRAGDRLQAGDVLLDVLHPPASGPEGNENARSLVVQVRHGEHVLLLTGDLEGPGLERLLQLPRRAIDVLQAPHHGSPASNTPALAQWASPQLVISSQGPSRGGAQRSDPYTVAQIPYLRTHHDGAIILRSHAQGLVLETFRSGRQFVLRGIQQGPGPERPSYENAFNQNWLDNRWRLK